MCRVLSLTLGWLQPLPAPPGRWRAALSTRLFLKAVFPQRGYPASRGVDFFSGMGGLTYGVKRT